GGIAQHGYLQAVSTQPGPNPDLRFATKPLALRIPRLDQSPQRPSLPLDPGQGVLDPGRRPGSPRQSEELEPLLDEEDRVHPRRDEIHCGDAAVLRGGRREFIERSLIEVALVGEW